MPDWLIVGLLGLALSVAMLVLSVPTYRKYGRVDRVGLLGILIGGLGVLLSVGWMLLVAWVDSVVR